MYNIYNVYNIYISIYICVLVYQIAILEFTEPLIIYFL